jgi:hypothetical protein
MTGFILKCAMAAMACLPRVVENELHARKLERRTVHEKVCADWHRPGGWFRGGDVRIAGSQGRQRHLAYGQLDLFSDAFERVRANYVRPVKDSELVDAAIQGMVSNLDPHSSYMDAKMYGDMQITTRGQFAVSASKSPRKTA